MSQQLRTVGGLLARQAEANPDAPFLVWQGTTTSYGAMNDLAARAAVVWSQLGVTRGDRVAVVADNRPEYLVAWFGLARIGAILVGVNTGYKTDEIAYLLDHAAPMIVLADDDWIERVEPLASGRGIRVMGFGADAGEESFIGRVNAIDGMRSQLDAHPGDVVSLIYTSGTTGSPKAVMQTHENYVLTGEAYAHWTNLSPTDVLYACLPYFHINAQGYTTMCALAVGVSIVLAPRFSASRFWSEVTAGGVTVVNLVGAMLIILDRLPPSSDDAANRVRLIYSGGAMTGLTAEERERISQRYGVEFIGGYGMSEMTFGCIETSGSLKKPGSMGVPRQHPDPTVPRTEALIIDDTGRECGVDEPGELLLRGPGMMVGYFRDPDATARVLVDGWMRTGDVVRRDADGYLFFVDRKKDVIRRRGENIYSGEVEAVIRSHPAVAEVAVVAVPSEFMDDEVFAFVIPRNPETPPQPAEIVEWTAARLAAFKAPRFVAVVDDVPRTETNKLAKGELRARAAAGQVPAYDHLAGERGVRGGQEARGGIE